MSSPLTFANLIEVNSFKPGYQCPPDMAVLDEDRVFCVNDAKSRGVPPGSIILGDTLQRRDPVGVILGAKAGWQSGPVPQTDFTTCKSGADGMSPKGADTLVGAAAPGTAAAPDARIY